jgi:pre-mRNA-processing factor 17
VICQPGELSCSGNLELYHPHLYHNILDMYSNRTNPSSGKGAVPTGFAEEVVISDSTFRSQHRAIESAAKPNIKKRKREERGDASVLYGDGAYKGPFAKWKDPTPEAATDESGSEIEIEVTDSEEDGQDSTKVVKKEIKFATDYIPENQADSSDFLGSERLDWQGRTYMHVPRDLDTNLLRDTSDERNFVPKKLVHTWKDMSGESGKAITGLKFFPNYGHLLLATSASGKVLLYDVYRNGREALRSYNGHNRGVTDVCFNNDGTSFITSSQDRSIKLWDTETGACKVKFSTNKTPRVIKFNPDPSHNSEFLAGMQDKKILQYDIRTPDQIVQEYDHHIDAINTLTFCDEARRFVSTSDDRSLRAWEYGIPVPIKIVSEPDMFALSRAAAHPKKEMIAFQGADNEIHVYGSSDRFRQNRKKGFRGHNTAGSGIDLDISPDGEFMLSGDNGGYFCVWSWKTCKMLHKMKAAENVPILACGWHPKERATIVTGDAKGIIKLWD